MSDPRTIEQRTEDFFVHLTRSLTDTEDMLDRSMCPSVHLISDGHATAKARNALIEALADLEDQSALFRWTAANAAMHSRSADPSAELDVRLIIHSRGESAFDFIEGHALALIEIVARMREKGELRDDVLDVRQHAKRLVDWGKSLDLPRKPRKRL